MRFHHDKHHQTYVDKANAALAGTGWEDVEPSELLTRLDELPEAIRAAVAQQRRRPLNHSMFWRACRPTAAASPTASSCSAIRETFRTFAIFKETMEAAAMSTFGSGWAWLVHDGTRVLIVTTTNQDNPISDGLTPLLGRRRLGARLLPRLREPPRGVRRRRGSTSSTGRSSPSASRPRRCPTSATSSSARSASAATMIAFGDDRRSTTRARSPPSSARSPAGARWRRSARSPAPGASWRRTSRAAAPRPSPTSSRDDQEGRGRPVGDPARARDDLTPQGRVDFRVRYAPRTRHDARTVAVPAAMSVTRPGAGGAAGGPRAARARRASTSPSPSSAAAVGDGRDDRRACAG